MSISEEPFEGWMLPGISPFGMLRASPRFAIDVREKDNEYLVYAALPGVSPQQVNIQAQGNTLWLSGDIPEEQPKEAGEWLLRERPAGHFERMLTFPVNVSTEEARAEFRHGMLVIELPKGRAGREIPIRQIQQREPAQRQAGVAQSARQQGAKAMEEQGAMPMGSGLGPEQQAGQVRSGMTVYGTNGNEIGMVKDIRSNDFLVSRSLHRDIYVPLNAVQSVSNDQVYLNIPSDQVDDMNWPNPPMFGESSS